LGQVPALALAPQGSPHKRWTAHARLPPRTSRPRTAAGSWLVETEDRLGSVEAVDKLIPGSL